MYAAVLPMELSERTSLIPEISRLRTKLILGAVTALADVTLLGS